MEKATLFAIEKPLDIFDDVECNYGIKFFKSNFFTKWISNISKKKFKAFTKY